MNESLTPSRSPANEARLRAGASYSQSERRSLRSANATSARNVSHSYKFPTGNSHTWQ